MTKEINSKSVTDAIGLYSNSNSSITDLGCKASTSGTCHSYRDHSTGEALSKASCASLHLRTWDIPSRGPWVKRFQVNCVNLIQMCPNFS